MKLTEEEKEFLRKYNALDERGKKRVDNIIAFELEYSIEGRILTAFETLTGDSKKNRK